MEKTIDDKIDQLKHEGVINVPRQNTLAGLAQIECLLFQTRPLCNSFDPDYCFENYELDGGCRIMIDSED